MVGKAVPPSAFFAGLSEGELSVEELVTETDLPFYIQLNFDRFWRNARLPSGR
jgi:hypothetical protein